MPEETAPEETVSEEAAAGPRSAVVVVEVDVPFADAELAAEELFALGASAVVERPCESGVTLVADLPGDPPSAIAGRRRPRVVEVDPTWRDAWREHAGSWRAGPFVVRPPWLAPTGTAALRPDEVEVVVDPGDAFGSGSHPTTRLCLELLGELVTPGDRVLDVGCGSGILAVGALLLGAGRALGVDVDPAAPAVAAEVARANGVGDRLEATTESLGAVSGRWDLVLANLLIPVIEELGPHIAARARPGGVVVVSGLLEHQCARAATALAPLVVRRWEFQDDWWALVLDAEAAAGRD